MRVGVVNYGMGNLGSVSRALEDVGADVVIVDNPKALFEVSRIVLPGVGAFGEGMGHLRDAGWVDVLREIVIQRGTPLLGICLGMQILATYGCEGGVTAGLDLIPGRVQRLDTLGCKLRIPHVGWNEVKFRADDVLFDDIPDSSDFYFVHSYAFVPGKDEHLISTVDYGVAIAATVRRGNVFGCQFHPEKSSKAGRNFLRNFVGYAPC